MVNAQVYKGVRSGVQPVAIKVLHEVNDAEAAAFAEVRCHLAADCACSEASFHCCCSGCSLYHWEVLRCPFSVVHYATGNPAACIPCQLPACFHEEHQPALWCQGCGVCACVLGL